MNGTMPRSSVYIYPTHKPLQPNRGGYPNRIQEKPAFKPQIFLKKIKELIQKSQRIAANRRKTEISHSAKKSLNPVKFETSDSDVK